MITKVKPDYSVLKKGSIHMFCGFPKCGKTTAAATFGEKGTESVLILDVEDGADYVEGANIIKIRSLVPPTRQAANGEWEIIPPLERGYHDPKGNPVEAWSYIEALDYITAKWEELGYESIVIDTIDALLNWVNEYVVEDLKYKDSLLQNPKYQEAEDIGDFDYAAGHSMARNKIKERITQLTNMVRNTGVLIIISHMNKTISVRDGGKVIPQKLPNLPEKLAQWIGGNAETICMISKNDKGQFLCSFDGYGETMVGSKLKPLMNKTIMFKESGEHTLYNQIMNLLKNKE